MSQQNEQAIIHAALRRMGLADDDETPVLTPLTGGVSSLILRADTRRGPVCVKQALPALRVASEWLAPLARNHAEVDWLNEVARHAPQSVPRVLGQDRASHCFAMSWLPPQDYPVWKLQLRDGQVDPAFAAQVGSLVAGIHARTAGDAALAVRFAHDAQFHALRLDPYFNAAANRHPDCAAVLHALVARTAASHLSLVHGDISPKNLLVGPQGPVILDAECAWYGEPAFDAAFCLCHLLAKCLWQPAHTERYLSCFDAFANAYLAGASWISREEISDRIALLLAALLLARVDGKSPLEYLDDAGREFQRQYARHWLLASQRSLSAMRADWERRLSMAH